VTIFLEKNKAMNNIHLCIFELGTVVRVGAKLRC